MNIRVLNGSTASHMWEIRLINVKITSDQPKSVLLISLLLISYPRFSVNFDA